MASTSAPPSVAKMRANNESALSRGETGSSTALPIRSSNPLSAKVSSLLSASYSDAGFKETLELIDERHIPIDAKGRRTFQLNLHKEIIDQNGQVLDEFRKVTEVRIPLANSIIYIILVAPGNLTSCTSKCDISRLLSPR